MHLGFVAGYFKFLEMLGLQVVMFIKNILMQGLPVWCSNLRGRYHVPDTR